MAAAEGSLLSVAGIARVDEDAGQSNFGIEDP
jgi:hypothetical protein